MKGQDILILLKVLLKDPGAWRYDLLAHELSLSKSMIHSGITRLKEAGLMRESLMYGCSVPNIEAMAEFFVHGLKYVFPAEEGKETRGVVTAHSALPLKEVMMQDETDIYVWPCDFGMVRGKSIKPLHKSAPKAAELDQEFYELLVLVDGLRAGRAREANLSQKMLLERFNKLGAKFRNAY